jgi:ATP-dependent RNA helicase DeaD
LLELKFSDFSKNKALAKLHMSDFKTLGISKNLIKGLDELGITRPTEVQEKAIPFLIKEGSDFVCRAQTGTGKTAAFGLPLLQRINPKSDKVQGLILVPTRELAQQVAKHLFKFTKYTDKIFTEAVYGGDKIELQVKALERRTHIIVATPGRLNDLLKLNAVDLSTVKRVILDEADEMLTMGFREHLTRIINQTTNRESMWLFSATIPEDIQKLVKIYMSHDAKHLLLESRDIMAEAITHQFLRCQIGDKPDRIAKFLERRGKDRGLIFVRSKAGAIALGEKLNDMGFATGVLPGHLSQKDQEKIMRAFRKERIQYVVATDVAARGIDIEGLSFVIHHQLPENSEYYIHRSGRTARAGKTGISFALIAGKDAQRMHVIEKELKITFQQVA